MKSLKRKSGGAPAEDTSKKAKHSDHWSQGLSNAIANEENVIKSDDLVVVIKDKYPKAEFHYLILPKEDISSLKTLTASNHSKLLKHMEKVGKEIVEKHKDKEFKLGYHAEPSMTKLHLHIISDDMTSDCMKTKKHWNSFNTSFFLQSEKIRKNLKENGKVVLPSKEEIKKWMNSPLKCHKCNYEPKHMPDLKKHILEHKN